jgi:hypothetical protein
MSCQRHFGVALSKTIQKIGNVSATAVMSLPNDLKKPMPISIYLPGILKIAKPLLDFFGEDPTKKYLSSTYTG